MLGTESMKLYSGNEMYKTTPEFIDIFLFSCLLEGLWLIWKVKDNFARLEVKGRVCLGKDG